MARNSTTSIQLHILPDDEEIVQRVTEDANQVLEQEYYV